MGCFGTGATQITEQGRNKEELLVFVLRDKGCAFFCFLAEQQLWSTLDSTYTVYFRETMAPLGLLTIGPHGTTTARQNLRD